MTSEDYARAERFLPGNAARLILNAKLEPHWLDNGDRFWYRRETRDGCEFIRVDSATGSRGPAFDHARLAAALSAASGRAYEHHRLPFDRIEFSEDGGGVVFEAGDARWRCDLSTYACERTEHGVAPKTELRSPDGRSAAVARGHNLWLRNLTTGEEWQVTRDGEQHYDYASRPEGRLTEVTDRLLGRQLAPVALWSPDSRRLLTYRLDQRAVREMHLLQARPSEEDSRPVLHSYRYPLPGDANLAQAELLIIDAERTTTTWLATAPLPITVRTPFEQRLAWWSDDSERVYVIHAERGCIEVSLDLIDAASGAARRILSEHGETQVFPHHVPFESTNVHEAAGGAEVSWFSQRDGWGHLYLYDTATGALKRQLTSGAWTVRDVVRVDNQGRWIYFTAGGREPGRDPYFRHLYRVSLDGGEPALLTPEDAEHAVTCSPNGACFVDTYSRVDLTPVSVLRRADGSLICELEHADISALRETGWRFPERFSVKARDGVTELYGAIIRPSRFDASHRYPVIDAIYPGPQTIRTPKAFPSLPHGGGFWQDQAIAELGFVVVTIDGMGTPYRSKAFIDVSYGAGFGEAGGLVDHVGGLRQLAARDPSLDLSRVGIYGHSGGGYASTRALLLFPDFYTVAVSSSGNHDQRGYNANWGERYLGPFDAERYEAQANARLAQNLRGKLLLVHGELDDNVHPSLSVQLVDALIQANKDFDFLILPNCNHALFDLRRPPAEANEGGPSPLDNPYFIRRRWDYFVRHLRGASPPVGYAINPASSALRKT
jgi:dipeptidyl-peptidase-4